MIRKFILAISAPSLLLFACGDDGGSTGTGTGTDTTDSGSTGEGDGSDDGSTGGGTSGGSGTTGDGGSGTGGGSSSDTSGSTSGSSGTSGSTTATATGSGSDTSGGTATTGGTTGTTGGTTTGATTTTSLACGGNCTDANATCSQTDVCECSAGYYDTDGNATDDTATCALLTVVDIEVTLAATHDRLGNLVVKLVPPGGNDTNALTLMSRPGYAEPADDGALGGTGPTAGEYSDISSGYPILFTDNPSGPTEGVDWLSAEDMGGDGVGNAENVCQDGDDNVCDFRPAQGSWEDPPQDLGEFDGDAAAGTWQLCIGDAADWDALNSTGTGVFDAWTLHLETEDGVVDHASGAAANMTISDDTYDGTIATMACIDVVVSF